MNNNDERDYEEEAANRALMEEVDEPEMCEKHPEQMLEFDSYTYVCAKCVVEPAVASAKVSTSNTIGAEAEVPQKWYFTFGYDHKDPVTGVRLHNKYCVVEGLHDEARAEILKRFDVGWSMQYAHADDVPIPEGEYELPHFKYRGAGVERYHLELFDHRTSAAVIAESME